MAEQKRTKPTVIDEQGLPVISTPAPDDVPGGPYGMPNAYQMPGMPPIPDNLVGRNGRISLFKLIGWKGIALLVLVTAGLVALAAASFFVALIAVPVLLLLAGIGWVAAKVGGPASRGGGYSVKLSSSSPRGAK